MTQTPAAPSYNCGVAGSAPGRWPCAPSQPCALSRPLQGRARAKLSGFGNAMNVTRKPRPTRVDRVCRSPGGILGGLAG
jgi:hypothetical protein